MSHSIGEHKNLKPDARMIIFLNPKDPTDYEVGACGINSEGEQAVVVEDPKGPPHPLKHTQHIRLKYTENPCVWIGSKRVCW
jgi:hypothetical protein